MLQVHSIILWANAKNEKFETSLDKSYALMMSLEEFGTEVSPKYLTVTRKKDAKLFEWSYDSFGEHLKKGINKEGDAVFHDLGYCISFFSSLVNDDSAGISIQIGVSNPKFFNSFVVNLPISLPLYTDPILSDKIILLFKKCVDIFDPFWGCISNNMNARRYDSFWRKKLPSTVHWINYFGEDIVKQIGVKKIEKVPVSIVEKFSKGYIVQMKKKPLDDSNDADLKIQKTLNEYYGF